MPKQSTFDISHTKREAGGRAVQILGLKGEIDSDTFSRLQRSLEEIAAGDQPRVVLDCKGLDYISSAGLAVLKKMSREFRNKQGDIRLAALTPKVNNVVDLLGFNHVLKVFGAVDEAVDSYGAKS